MLHEFGFGYKALIRQRDDVLKRRVITSKLIASMLIAAQCSIATNAESSNARKTTGLVKRAASNMAITSTRPLAYDRKLLELIESAKQSRMNRDTRLSEIKYRNIMNQYPMYPDGYIGMATCRTDVNDLPGAKFYLEKALAKNPKSIAALAGLARLYDQQGDRENCINCFRRLVAVESTATNWLLLGDVQALYADRVNALKCYQKACAVSPNDPEVWNALGLHAMRDRDYERASVCFRKSLSLDSKNKQAKHLLAMSFLRRNRLEEAEKVFIELVAQNPKSEYWSDFGIIALRQHDLAAAEERLSMALKLYPNKPYNLLLWAVLKEMQGQPKEAEVFYRTALKIEPKYLNAYIGLGELLSHTGRLQEARNEFQRVTVIAPRNIDGWYHMGVVCSELGESAKAIEYLEKALSLAPKDVPLMCDLATAFRQSGQKKRSEQVARRAFLTDRRSDAALITYGIALMDLHKYKDAVTCFQEAAKIVPKEAKVWNNLGAALTYSGDLKHAEEAFRKAIAVHPKHAKAWANLGTVLEQSGNRKGAKKALTEAVKSCPEDHVLLYELAESLEQLGERKIAVDARKVGLDAEPNEADLLMNVPYIMQQASTSDPKDRTKRFPVHGLE